MRAITAFVCLFTSVALAQDIIRYEGKWLGTRQIAKERNTWRSLKIEATRNPTDRDFVYVDALDFFTLEYGRPFAPVSFTVPEKGKGEWKTVHTDIRLGRGWGKIVLGRYSLVMELEQDRPTEWRFLRWGDRGREQTTFSATGAVMTVKHNCGVIWTLEALQNFEVACLTAGAKVKIKSLKLVPVLLPIEFRRRFTLAELPWKAGYTSMNRNVTVNGRQVWSNTMNAGICRSDITPLLKIGTNEIVVSYNENSGWGGPTHSLMYTEAFYVTKDGATVMLGGDQNWEWRFGAGEWKPVKAWVKTGLERLPNGVEVCSRGGYDPMHAGPLTVTPKTRDGFPLFDEGEPIEWNVSYPPEMKGVTVERQLLTPNQQPATHDSQLPSGAYRVRWTLRRGDKVLDIDEKEMIVLGRIPQDEIPYADFEREMSRRLKLLQEIDCTKVETNPTNFLDHAGGNRQGENLGGVEDVGGIVARVTGANFGDFIGYPIAVGKLGDAHIAEIEFPDVDERAACCAILCTYPNDFSGNQMPGGVRPIVNATGSFRTGGIQPNTGKVQTMRIVFFPGSSNVTVTVENAMGGLPAAVTKIRVYRVAGGLPALKLPKTDRIYANHCERPIEHDWGAFVNPSASFYSQRGPYVDGWRTAYEAAANRIRALRYAGHNAAVEGVFMYRDHFPTESGNSTNPNLEYDFFWVVARLCAKNGIRIFPCFEYMRSPRLGWTKGYDVSDREIMAGTKRGIYNVDWSGRQRLSYMNAGINYLAPEVWESITNLTREVYERYSSLPNVEGLFTVNGFWWLPGFTLANGINLQDVGFDDDSVELFTRETGIDFDGGLKGEARFARRKELAFGRCRREWNSWRAHKLRSSLETMAGLLKGREHDWKIFSAPHITYPTVTAFTRLDATKADRDGYHAARMLEAGFDVSLYGKGADTPIQLVPEVNYQRLHDMSRYGALFCEGSKRLYADNGAVYFSAIGLDEHFGMTSRGRKAWWWRWVGSTVYDVKPSGRNAFYDFVDVLSETSPRYMFHTWLDMNLTTGHAEEARRFLTGFLATPVGELRPTALVKGVSAKVMADVLQLVNATPYPVAGRLEPKGRIYDAITCRTYDTAFDYALEPWGVTCMRGALAPETTGAFRFGDADAKTVRDDAATVLDHADLAAAIDRSTLERLDAARKAGDDYGMARLLRDVEILSPLLRYRSSGAANANQEKFIAALKRDGVARIDCGSQRDNVDERCRLWLTDQAYAGFGAYGNLNGRYADRGNVRIARTAVESVYRTECGSDEGLGYVIPVPDGDYEVTLHIAETWDTLPGRQMEVSVCGARRPVDVWGKAGGRMAAMQETWQNVRPVKGAIRIDFFGNSIVNGIEIKVVGERPEQVFKTPPKTARAGVWWHWMGSQVTEEGIAADLDWFKRMGVFSATVFGIADCCTPWARRIGNVPTGGLRPFDTQWWRLFAFACREGQKRGIDIGLHNCPGYTSTGGRWIPARLAMRELVFGVTNASEQVSAKPNAIFPVYNEDARRYEMPPCQERKTDCVFIGLARGGIRVSHVPMGAFVQPADWDSFGLECDKMNPEAVDCHLDMVFGDLKEHLGGDLRAAGLRHILLDSYEAGTPTWTPRMREEFKSRRGYDPLEFLPILGGITNFYSVAEVAKFRSDFDRTVKDLYRDVLFRRMASRIHAEGLEFSCEPYWGPFEPCEVAPCIDRLMTEFWYSPSGAHINAAHAKFNTFPGPDGRRHNIVEAEAFTGQPGDCEWTEMPGSLKLAMDDAFIAGINRLILHTCPLQPWGDDVKPGVTMGRWGTHFGRNQTWAECGKAWFDYAARCQALLQWGEISAADLALPRGVRQIARTNGPRTLHFIVAGTNDVACLGLPRGRWFDPVTGKIGCVPAGLRAGQSGFYERDDTVPQTEASVVFCRQRLTAFEPALGDWTKSTVPETRHFSGTVIYRTAFDRPAGASGVSLRVKTFGQVVNVWLNGDNVGTLWCAPEEIVLPIGAMKANGNILELDVTNSWRNRLIGDELEPPDCTFEDAPLPGGSFLRDYPEWFAKGMAARPSKGRRCFTTWNYFTKDSPLVPSGLIEAPELIWRTRPDL